MDESITYVTGKSEFVEPKEKELEYMSKINVQKCLKEDFTLTVDDTFVIIGVGTVVNGMINTGMCRVGEIATVARYETTITAIDIHTKDRKPNNAAYATEHVGLGLRGISKDQIKKGDIVKIKNRNNFQM